MKNQIRVAFVVAIVGLAGCGDPTIDASSDESMKQSMQEVREALPAEKRAEFDEALRVLAFSQFNMKDMFTQGINVTGNIESSIRESLDGKTAQEVIAEAERIRSDRKERERQQALNEIRELEAKRLRSESARNELKKFRVIRSRFYMRQEEYFGKQPIIELTVKNGTTEAVSRAYFEGTLASPDRSVPWHKDVFNYSISGGIEPGEEASWSLAPNRFSDWGKVEAPVDAVFTVTVERLDGADGEPLYSTMEFSEYDEKRLIELKDKYDIE